MKVSVKRGGGGLSNLGTAKYFSEQLRNLEITHAGEAEGDHREICGHLFFASLFGCVTSLEILYNDTISKREIDKEFCKAIEFKDLLMRFSLLMKFLGIEPIAKGDRLAQRVAAVIAMRNAAIHYRPRYDDDAKESDRLQKLFPEGLESPLQPDTLPFFPGRCCSHACAEWCIASIEGYVAEVSHRLEIEVHWAEGSWTRAQNDVDEKS